MRPLDPAIVRLQIEYLRAQHPELVESDEDWLLAIESETDAVEFLRMVERKRQEALHMAGAIARNIKELGKRQQRFERREAAMRALKLKVMLAADVQKIELPEATLSVRNGTPKVIITDLAIIPDILCKIERAPDKVRIKDMLKAGQVVRGAELSNAEPVLSIRTK